MVSKTLLLAGLIASAAGLQIKGKGSIDLFSGQDLPSHLDGTRLASVCTGGTSQQIFSMMLNEGETMTSMSMVELGGMGIKNMEGDFELTSTDTSLIATFTPPRGEISVRQAWARVTIVTSETKFTFGIASTVYGAVIQLEYADEPGVAVTMIDFGNLMPEDSHSEMLVVNQYGSCPMEANIVNTIAGDGFSLIVDGTSLTATFDATTLGEQSGVLSVGSMDIKLIGISGDGVEVCSTYMFNGLPWFDKIGAKFNCSWYDINEKCSSDGINVFYANEGVVAKEACCQCGGGATLSNPQPEIEACDDLTLDLGDDKITLWHDSFSVDKTEFNCDWYVKNKACASDGDKFAKFGATANEACCLCGAGGGVRDGSSARQMEQCTDETLANGDDWQDSGPGNGKYDCHWYAGDAGRCESFGDQYPTEDMTAKDACCSCRGL